MLSALRTITLQHLCYPALAAAIPVLQPSFNPLRQQARRSRVVLHVSYKCSYKGHEMGKCQQTNEYVIDEIL